MINLVTLVPLSALCGIMTALVFRRFRSPDTRRTVNRILAHLMELRLFFDEPRLILNVQRNLLRENLRLFKQIAVPALITAPIIGLVMWQADAVYGRAPLPAGQLAIVTAHVRSGDLAGLQLQAPPDVVVETPGVRIPRLREVSWRVRPKQPFSGHLSVNGHIERLDIPWPHTSWMIWFFVISALSALLTGRRAAMLLLLACPLSAAEQPPVILISIDTLRADHHSPNIDAFGDGGTTYTLLGSQVTLTLPSHSSLMMSTYPFQNRVEVNGDVLPAGAVTLASILRTNGYRTAAFIGSAVLDRRYGLDQGFDVYDSPFAATRVRRDAALVTRAARLWVEKNGGRPAFVFIHLYDLHTPYTLPNVASLMPNAAGYNAELAYIDQTLGRFREALMRDGLWEKALVVLLADHGEALGDHGETSHGYFVYESTIHVPLIIHWPGGAPTIPDRVYQPGGLIDVAPTILDFLHIPAPPSFEGTSLLPGHGERVVFSESVYPEKAFGWAPLRALRSGSYKYISAPRAELYDLGKDPGERTNILTAHLQQGQAMKAQIDDLMARRKPPPSPETPEVSAHARQVLSSLGCYLPAAEENSACAKRPIRRTNWRSRKPMKTDSLCSIPPIMTRQFSS